MPHGVNNLLNSMNLHILSCKLDKLGDSQDVLLQARFSLVLKTMKMSGNSVEVLYFWDYILNFLLSLIPD